MSVPSHGPLCRKIRCYPTVCPTCGEEVYFYKCSCGSKVYFDELSLDWPKHECITENYQEPNTIDEIKDCYKVILYYEICKAWKIVCHSKSRKTAHWHFKKTWQAFMEYKNEPVTVYLMSPGSNDEPMGKYINISNPNMSFFVWCTNEQGANWVLKEPLSSAEWL
jgi:hypothetical protein